MFIFTNFLQAIASIVDTLLSLYFWVVIISALLSWVNPDPYNPIVRILRNLTEPVFYRVRKWLPFTYVGGVDLSPIVVLMAIQFLKIFLVQSMLQIAMQLN
ncbi:YggT family protein [Desulfohalobiaceae bacterium Ax17]|uniref:YggT family protein n=1 Tax=Desulfovulcanus ferrireducens TaxID=2831190 RepID=UPI00207BB974|nr:YggT family protein [Desulfovulcanus ferrireducens]MBT8763006.1 YggT family protein [Desulfovulcanus ferrireducens]